MNLRFFQIIMLFYVFKKCCLNICILSTWLMKVIQSILCMYLSWCRTQITGKHFPFESIFHSLSKERHDIFFQCLSQKFHKVQADINLHTSGSYVLAVSMVIAGTYMFIWHFQTQYTKAIKWHPLISKKLTKDLVTCNLLLSRSFLFSALFANVWANQSARCACHVG